MAIPIKTREQIIETLELFDQELRPTPGWAEWTQKKKYRYAIRYNDRLYPMRDMIRLATGVQEFRAKQAVRYLQELGLSVIRLQDPVPHDLVRVSRDVSETGLAAEHEDKRLQMSVYEFIEEQGFVFSKEVITNYLLSLMTKPFVILAGISGTGKTKIAQLVADYVTGGHTGRSGQPSTSRVAFLAVRPDWTDHSSLLGFYNAITETYEVTPLLKLLLQAERNPRQAYFVILDEMNLAKVEHYFSDFLSCLESRRLDAEHNIRQEAMLLHNRPQEVVYTDEQGVRWTIPQELRIPTNVLFTGTVNVDETTYMFSPKVLDRANTIEFHQVYLSDGGRDEAQEFAIFHDGSNPFAPRYLERLLLETKPPTRRDYEQFQKLLPAQYPRWLQQIHAILERHHLHFGYRVANEIAVYMKKVWENCAGESCVYDIAFDLQVMQKILPKLHGNTAKLEAPLQELQGALDAQRLPRSYAKIERMLRSLLLHGFAAFLE